MKVYKKIDFKIKLNKAYCIDAIKGMKRIPNNIINLTVTSPPYDNLRKYGGYEFNFEDIAKELFRVTAKGGIVVWVVGDATIEGSETGTSFKQALYFKEIGFNLHDTMIYKKVSPIPLNLKNRYNSCFEYMFVFSKGIPNHGKVIQVPVKNAGRTYRVKRNNATTKDKGSINKKDKIYTAGRTRNENNIWNINPVGAKEYKKHSAQFPEQLVKRHIISWSNEGDIVLDPMVGSGTTLKMAKLLKRRFIGFDIERKYIEITKDRLKEIPSIDHRLI